jgi:DNA-directed RNA polymerase alpha subunit
MKKNNEAHPFAQLGKPAQRALANASIQTPEQLSRLTEKEVMQLHGMGKSSLPILKEAMAERGFTFAQNK